MDEPADSFETDVKDQPQGCSTTERSASRRSTPGRSPSGRSTPGLSTASEDRRSTTPEPPPVPPATYHWEEVRRKRSVGGYPWTHLNKPPFDEKTWMKYERDHVYEPVAPGTDKTQRSSPPAKLRPTVDDGQSGRFLRIPLTEELVMADETGSEDERQRSEGDGEQEEEDDDDDDVVPREKKKASSAADESIYEGENESSSEPDATAAASATAAAAGSTRMKAFQQKVKVKAGVLRGKLQGVTKRKPRQKIVVDAPAAGGGGGGERGRGRRKIGQFATLPKRFTFNAAKVNFSNTFGSFARSTARAHHETAGAAEPDETKSGRRFSLPRRFGFSKTSSESPGSRRSLRIGASRLSVPGFRPRTWSEASKPDDSHKSKLMEFATYPRIFSKRRKTNAANETPPPPPPTDDAEPNSGDCAGSRKQSFRRRFFRSHKESTPGRDLQPKPRTATLAVEEELDEARASRESLAEFGDSDLHEVISLSDDRDGHRSCKDTKSLSEHGPGVIEEIDSDEFFLREKGLSRGDVHISNYLSSEIRHVFRSNRTRSAERVANCTGNGNTNTNNNNSGNDDGGSGTATPVRPSRTNSLRRPVRSGTNAATSADPSRGADRFSTMPKSFGGTKSSQSPGDGGGSVAAMMRENIITSRTFEPSREGAALPGAFRVPWRTAGDTVRVSHVPPKPPARQRMSKFSTFDTRSMIDLSRKRSQFGLAPTTTNFSETAPRAPLRRSRTSLAGSERDVSAAVEDRCPAGFGTPTPPLRRSRTSLAGSERDVSTAVEDRCPAGFGTPTPPLRRSRMSLTATDAEDAGPWKAVTGKCAGAPPRPPPPSRSPGYATVDRPSAAQALLHPPQSPARHRRKKSYETIKGQEFGAFFTVPRSYRPAQGRPADEGPATVQAAVDPPCRPARSYNTLGPSRPRRRRAPVREHEYGDVSDGGRGSGGRPSSRSLSFLQDDDDNDDDGTTTAAADGCKAALSSGDVIEKMKFRPLPSPPPPPRCKGRAAENCGRRNTDSALVSFLDRRGTSATSSDHDFFADVSRALLASAAANAPAPPAAAAAAVQTDPLPDRGYEPDDLESSSAESDGPTSGGSSSLAAAAAATAAERPTSRASAEYAVDRPTSGTAMSAVRNGYAAAGVIRAHRISVDELKVGRMTVAEFRGGSTDVMGDASHLRAAAQLMAAAGVNAPPSLRDSAAAVARRTRTRCDDDASARSSRVSSVYPEADSDSDRGSVKLAAPTPPRRRSKPPGGSSPARLSLREDPAVDAPASAVAARDPSVVELSCQLFRLCHANVCSLFNKVAHQVVPEDTEKRRDLQAALCFLSIVLAGLLILGFGNEKTVHHHHWDFQFPPPNQ